MVRFAPFYPHIGQGLQRGASDTICLDLVKNFGLLDYHKKCSISCTQAYSNATHLSLRELGLGDHVVELFHGRLDDVIESEGQLEILGALSVSRVRSLLTWSISLGVLLHLQETRVKVTSTVPVI